MNVALDTTRRYFRLVAWPAGIGLAIAVLFVLGYQFQMLPRPVRREIVEGTLRLMLLGYVLFAAGASLGAFVLGWAVVRARKRREPYLNRARWLLLCITSVFSLAMAEASAAVWTAWAHRMPVLPTKFDPSDGAEHIVTIGGSGALGHPYDPNVSLGQVVALGLRRALPGRRFQADVLGELGATLADQHLKLAKLKQRPAALVLYTGHNEFTGRFEEERSVDLDEAPRSPGLHRLYRASLASPLCRLIYETLSHNRLDGPPPLVTRHRLIDSPMFTPSEAADILDDFRRRMDRVVGWAEEVGAVPIIVLEVGDEAGYAPNRSLLPVSASAEERRWVEEQYRSARLAESGSDWTRAEELYRELVRRQPGFAEGHFRLGRLLERSGRWSEALEHYLAARDQDGMPFRCVTAFQDVCRDVARWHPRAILVDGPAAVRAICAHGIVDAEAMQDGVHASLRGIVALARAVLSALRARGALGWTAGSVPALDPAQVAAELGMDRDRWMVVCNWGQTFYRRVAGYRFESAESLATAERFEECRRRIAAGEAPADLGFERMSLRPLPELDAGASAPSTSSSRSDPQH